MKSWQPPGYQFSVQTISLSCWLVELWNDISPKQDNFPGFTKITTPLSCDSANPLLGIYPIEIPIHINMRYVQYGHCSIVYNSKIMETS